jgi:Animal haem peroxidase
MHTSQSAQISRRTFLAGAGTGAVMAATSSLLPAGALAQSRPRHFVLREDRFGRIFPNLPPFAEASQALDAALRDIGKPGGMLDAKDDLLAGPVQLIVDPALNVNNPNNPTHTAGTTFMGQFMDHDMTFDLSSRLGVPTHPADSANSRTPAFDLDSVYGGGPDEDPELYEDRRRRRSAIKFRIDSNGQFEDLPRDATSKAIIADPRNDENMMISGLQAAFLKFHNRAVDVVSENDRESPDEVFRRARRLTTWHYQWMIVHEFLPLFIGQETVDDILRNGRNFYRPQVVQIPVEFQGAAYRFGHSMVRPSYRANLAGANGQPFFGMIFDPAAESEADPLDLRGGARKPRRFIGWQTFFNFGSIPRPSGVGTLGEDVRPNKLIDGRISTPLFNLPLQTIASGTPPTSLPQRNLLRQVTWGMPSGQRVARVMGVPALDEQDLKDLKDYHLGLDKSTPLWLYCLKEAEVMAGGLHLGPVGARIVGEVIIGLLQLDRNSYAWHSHWRPTLPTISGRVAGDFRMIDFLAFAGVDPTSRGQ